MYDYGNRDWKFLHNLLQCPTLRDWFEFPRTSELQSSGFIEIAEKNVIDWCDFIGENDKLLSVAIVLWTVVTIMVVLFWNFLNKYDNVENVNVNEKMFKIMSKDGIVKSLEKTLKLIEDKDDLQSENIIEENEILIETPIEVIDCVPELDLEEPPLSTELNILFEKGISTSESKNSIPSEQTEDKKTTPFPSPRVTSSLKKFPNKSGRIITPRKQTNEIGDIRQQNEEVKKSPRQGQIGIFKTPRNKTVE